MLSFKNVFKGERIPCMSAGMRMPHPDSYIPVGCAIGVIMKLLKPRTLLEEVPSWRRLCEFIALLLPFPSLCFWHKVEVISAPFFSFQGFPATVDIWPWGTQIQTEPSLSRNTRTVIHLIVWIGNLKKRWFLRFPLELYFSDYNKYKS